MRNTAFTLTELLVALALLGLIATFTIPKLLLSQSDSQFNGIAKSGAAALAAAYAGYLNDYGYNPNMKIEHLTPYLKYVRVDTVTAIDFSQNGTTRSCSTWSCLLMPNGSIIRYGSPAFGGSHSTNAIWIQLDPDGKVTSDGNAGGPGKAVEFFLYYDGTVRTRGELISNTANSASFPIAADSAEDPPWFKW